MAVILLRPLKRNDTRRYADLIASEAPLDVEILALEVDDDLDHIYGTVNTILAAAEEGGTPALVWIGLVPPDPPLVGQLWWRPDDGNLYVYYDDGATAQWVPAMASVGTPIEPTPPPPQWYLVAGAVNGVPTAALSVGLYVAALAFTLPVGLTGSQASARSAATAATDFDVQVNGTTRGQIHFAAGATVATFVWPAAVSVVAGDRLEVIAAAAPDTTLADVAWTLKGTV